MREPSLQVEWIMFESNVLDKRLSKNPELRAEAFEAFVGGMGAMLRVFNDQISQIHDSEKQRQAVTNLHEQLRVLAVQAGRK